MVTKHRSGYVFQRGSTFYIQYMVGGRRVTQVLRDKDNNPITTEDAAEARRLEIMAPMMVAAQEEVLRTVQHRLDDAAKERDAVERGTDAGMKLAKAWDAYVASVNRPDSGPRTLEGYAAQWRQFLDWVATAHPVVTELRQVSGAVAEGYAGYMLKEIREKRKRPDGPDGKPTGYDEVIVKRSFTTNTYNKHVRVLELVFRVLARKAGLSRNPWAEIARKTEKRQSRRELTVQELNTICNRAKGELQTLLLVGIYTGLRLGDCCTLRWSEVDLDRRIILRVPNKTARRHGLPVHVPIHATLLGVLAQTPATKRNGYVLPKFAAMYKHEDADVAKDIRDHFEACGIQVHKDDTGVGTSLRAVVEVGFHSLRHSFVSLCRQSNAPLAVVEAIVGHSNPAMTRHYTHVGEVAAGAAVAALPAIGVGKEVKGQKTEVRGQGAAVVYGEQATPVAMARVAVTCLEAMTAKNWKQKRDEALKALRGATDWLEGRVLHEKSV